MRCEAANMPGSGPRRPTSSALGVPVEIYSADEAGEDPKGKSRQAEPGRPAIYIE